MAKHPESIWSTSVATLPLKPTGRAVKLGPVYLWKKTLFRQVRSIYTMYVHEMSLTFIDNCNRFQVNNQ